MLQAVFWDMDGTLVDTEPYWFKAERALLARFGVGWTDEQAEMLVGNALPDSAKILQSAGAELSVAEIVEHLTASVVDQVGEIIPWRPGAREMLAHLRRAAVPCAMVTMSHTALAETIVRQLPAGSFEFLITGEMVTHGKPHPEPYLRAADHMARRLGNLSLDRAVAIEDSIPGLASAVAAGVVTLGIPNVVPLPETAGATLWPTLAGKTVSDLIGLVEERAAAAGHRILS